MKQLTDIVLRVLIVTLLLGLLVGLYFVVKFLSVFGPVVYTLAGMALFGVAAYKLLNWLSKKG